MSNNECSQVKKVNVAHTRLPSIVKCSLVNTGKGVYAMGNKYQTDTTATRLLVHLTGLHNITTSSTIMPIMESKTPTRCTTSVQIR